MGFAGRRLAVRLSFAPLMILTALIATACGPKFNRSASSLFTKFGASSFSFTPASGPIGTLVTCTGTGLDFTTTQSVSIGGMAAVPVSESASELVALVMPNTPSGAVNVTTNSGSFNEQSFSVAATGIPTTQQGSKLVGTGAIGAAQQGTCVALSADGNTALSGGYADNSNTGAAWVFTRSGTTCSQESELVGTGAVGAAGQGSFVALSKDGNTALSGAWKDNSNLGATWVFTRSSGSWTQQAKLVGTGNIGTSKQGWTVALSADGNTALIGAAGDNSNVGAVWVFTRSGTSWTQQTKLIGTGNVGASQQGSMVALSADGNTAAVGGMFDNSNTGAVWIFTRSGVSWSQQAELVGTGATGAAEQGDAVALSADGNTILIGGEQDNSGVGGAWVFTRSGTTWTQQGSELVGSGAVGAANEGADVSLSADGNVAIIGGPADNTNAGAVWVFTRSGSTWTQSGSKLVGTGAVGSAQQGFSLALSADGYTMLSSGWTDNSNAGAIWVFTP